MSEVISKTQAKALWIQAQGLDQSSPFGKGPAATTKAVQHLGYVQIDTISVIERCHHHILYSRIPDYNPTHLHLAQSKEKTVFEYWTHALAYVPTKDFSFFLPAMNRHVAAPSPWFQSVKKEEMKKVLNLIKKNGPISIRDIQDDVLVEKDHEWGSRKPSKKALQYGFHCGQLVISERVGMLKKYELTARHFNWKKKPKAATDKEYNQYILDRSLRSQALVSLDSICHLNPRRKKDILKLIEIRIKEKTLIAVAIEGQSKNQHWMSPNLLEKKITLDPEQVHILSPFDPLIIQRKRLHSFFDYEHKFEAYIPKDKRVYGYFALPVLMGDEIVAVLDLKTDRINQNLMVQQWSWIGKQKSKANKLKIESELHRFEKFQLRK